MLILDSEKIVDHAIRREVDEARDDVARELAEQTARAVLIKDDKNPTNLEYQLGRHMTATEIETKLLKLCPDLIFLNHPHNASKKLMYRAHPDGSKEYIMPYESGLVPEHSVLQAVIAETLDPAVMRNKLHIERADLPKHEVIPHEFDEHGQLKKLGDVQFDERELRPGMVRNKQVWAERVRGWRTMLVILKSAGVITPTQAEAHFGSDNRPEWQHHMGKANHQLVI